MANSGGGRKKRGNGKQRASGGRPGFSLRGLFLKLVLAGAVVALLAVVYLDAVVRHKFEGKRWSVPARVYARPLELHPGLDYPPGELVRELRAIGYKERDRVEQPGEFRRTGERIILHSRGFRFWDGAERGRKLELRYRGDTVDSLRESGGGRVSIARLDPLLIGGIYPAHREDRVLINLSQVPPHLVDALVSVEDRNYYEHHGIAFRAIARAMVANVRARGFVQGGSTLTQQLVKNFYLSSDRTLVRKGIEAVMALLLDFHYSKDEILEAYLNEVYLGQSGRRAIHGFGLGAQFYFGRPLAELELHQVALLVGMVKGPSYYNPRRFPKRATARRNLVLDIMVREGAVSADQAAAAAKQPLGIAPSPSWSDAMFPAFIDLVRRQLRRDYREEDLTSEGLRIFTTLDPRVQWRAERSMDRTVSSLEKGYGVGSGEIEGAMVVTRTEGGEVLAVVGGRQARFSGFNRALDAVRPIGSLVKPAVYLTALQNPRRYTLATLLDDSPIRVESRRGDVWEPRNFDKESHGEVPLYRALARSLNQATARMGLEVGVSEVAGTLRRLGIERDVNPYPSLLLGSVELSPLEVAGIYQTLAGAGFSVHVRSIRDVLNARGEPLNRYPLAVEEKIDPAYVHLLQYGLQVAMAEGTGASAYRRLPQDLQAAGKTGTTNDLRDSWFAGYTGNLLAVVWLGRDDNGPTPLTGSSGALQVWTDLMYHLRPQPLIAGVPDRVRYHWIDEGSGRLSGENCEGARYIPFIEGSEPVARHPCAEVLYPVKEWFKRWFR